MVCNFPGSSGDRLWWKTEKTSLVSTASSVVAHSHPLLSHFLPVCLMPLYVDGTGTGSEKGRQPQASKHGGRAGMRQTWLKAGLCSMAGGREKKKRRAEQEKASLLSVSLSLSSPLLPSLLCSLLPFTCLPAFPWVGHHCSLDLGQAGGLVRRQAWEDYRQ